MSNVLKITKGGLSLPMDAVTQTFAILAKKRRGKTYTASVVAEEMIKAKLPFVALDPTGAWWGLRASADGKKAGYPVIIIGGEHGDIPITQDSGAAIAELVVDLPNYYIIDLSQMNSNAEQDRFATDFGERLYRVKAKRKFPMMLFVDEADCFVPQKPYPNQMRMLGAFDTIVRRGGIRGIGVTLISQRPAVISKNVLYQVECLIVLQILGKHDRDTIEGWVKQHGAKEQCDELMDSLASLDLGEGWLWSPAWLDKFERMQIRARETFNSSKTPEVGEEFEPPKVLAQVDIEKIRTKVAATIEQAELLDADKLSGKLERVLKQLQKANEQLADKDAAILELQDAMAKRPKGTTIKTVEKPVIGKKAYLEIGIAANSIRKSVAAVQRAYRDLESVVQSAERKVEQLERKIQEAVINNPMEAGKAYDGHVPPEVVIHTKGRNGTAQHHPGSTESLGRLHRVVLHVLASYGSSRIARLGVLAGYAVNGTFYNALSELRGMAAISGSNKDEMSITPRGISLLGPYPALPKDKALLQSHWINKFGKLPGEVLQHLIAYPRGSSIEDMSKHLGRPINGTFYNALSTLRTAGVLIGSNREVMKVSEDLL